MRLVSLLPSATEIICVLGLESDLVGVTHECDYPPTVARLPKVTHTLIPTDACSGAIDRLVRNRLQDQRALYTLDLAMLESLAPDLIVTQALCDVCAVAESEVQAAACALPHAPRVINLEPESLDQVFDAIRVVAQATSTERVAEDVIASLVARVEAVKIRSAVITNRPRVALLEWLDPPFSAGHWTPDLVKIAGGVDGFGRAGERSRTLTWDEIASWQPDVVFIACCGFGVERTLQDVDLLATNPIWRDLPAVRTGRVYVTDGSHYFSRPGPRLVDSLEILAHALHPEVHPLPEGVPAAVLHRSVSSRT